MNIYSYIKRDGRETDLRNMFSLSGLKYIIPVKVKREQYILQSALWDHPRGLHEA